jgi:methionyl-tRNA formyltransferase
MMRIIFMGSAEFACHSLERLLQSDACEVVAVVTQPDRPQGRNLAVAGCPVKQYVGERGIPILSPVNINRPENLEILRGLAPDLMVVVAYGQILKPDLLAIPAMGCINVHGSLLPKYRGAAPIQWAIASGEKVAGVTTMFINERMDAGDIILKRELSIAPDDTGGMLHDSLARVGAELLGETVGLLLAGKAPRQPQDESMATYAPKLSKSDGRMDWTLPAETLHNRVRAFNPWPGCCCELSNGSKMRIKILKARVEAAASGKPGTILDVDGDGLLVKAGGGNALRLIEVQPEGRPVMSGAAFLRGRNIKIGMELL